LLEFTVEELMRHLQRQFLPGMNWENYGRWHVDHILPLASFNYQSAADPEFKVAWALTNLRPMWARENISKGAKRLHLV
jgi:Uri superfamily endonuclease